MRGFSRKKDRSENKGNSKKNNLLRKKLIAQAFDCHSKGDFETAEKYYEKFFSNGFNDARVYSNLAILFKETSREIEALDLLAKSIKRYPNNSVSYAIISDILRSQGKLKEAHLSIDKAINIDPDVADYHFNLGLIFIGLRILSKAVISLKQAIFIDPKLIEAHLSLFSVQMDLSNLSEAELSIKKVIELDPNSSIAHFNLSRIYIELGKDSEAECSVKKAISLEPSFPQAYNNLGIILKNLDKPLEAEFSTRKAIELKDDYVEAYYNLANILRFIGKKEEALECTEKIMEIRPWSIIGSFSLNQKFEIKSSS